MCGYFCIGFIDFMLACKKLTDYTNLFLRKPMICFCHISKMNKYNAIEAIDKTVLS